MHQRKSFHATAVFCSPRKVCKVHVLEVTKQQQEEAETHRKFEARELRTSAALYKKQQLLACNLEQERARKVKKKQREEKSACLAASEANKQLQKEAENTQKVLQLSQRGKRSASQKAALKLKRAPRAVGVQGGEEMRETAPTEAPKQTMGRCQIKKLHKFG
jgi:hypothetical protein